MTPRSRALSRVERGDLCTGCGLCSAAVGSGKIAMEFTSSGFLRPRQVEELSSAEDSLVEAVCPGLRLELKRSEGQFHPEWGPLLQVRVGWATEPALRHHASSGGALSAVLNYLLEAREVDYVLEVAASPESAIRNTVTESRNRQDVFRAAGSRYAPSAPLSDICTRLERPDRFAFVGKPCDVAALRAYSERDPRVRQKIPYVISFFCAGIPSERGTRRILKELQVEEHELASFRYRGDGWPGAATARTKDGRERRMSYTRSWGDILSKHVQFRCKICPDGSGGFADVVFGDAWYSDDEGYPLFEEQDGRSLVLSRTEVGEALVRKACRAGYLATEPLEIGELVKMQPYQARRTRLTVSRLLALGLFARPFPRYRGLRLWRAALLAGLWPNLRSFLGMARRILLRRL